MTSTGAKKNGTGTGWAVETIGSHGAVKLIVETPAGKNGMPMSVEQAGEVVDALLMAMKKALAEEEADATWEGVDKSAIM